MSVIKDFSTVGEHAYTWQQASGEQAPIVRKLWLLVEVTELPTHTDNEET